MPWQSIWRMGASGSSSPTRSTSRPNSATPRAGSRVRLRDLPPAAPLPPRVSARLSRLPRRHEKGGHPVHRRKRACLSRTTAPKRAASTIACRRPALQHARTRKEQPQVRRPRSIYISVRTSTSETGCWRGDRTKVRSYSSKVESSCPLCPSAHQRGSIRVGFSGRLAEEKAPLAFIDVARRTPGNELQFLMTGPDGSNPRYAERSHA